MENSHTRNDPRLEIVDLLQGVGHYGGDPGSFKDRAGTFILRAQAMGSFLIYDLVCP